MGANSDRAKVATSSIVRLISVPSPKGRDSSAPPCYITSTSMRGYKAWRNFREGPECELRLLGILPSTRSLGPSLICPKICPLADAQGGLGAVGCEVPILQGPVSPSHTDRPSSFRRIAPVQHL